MATDTPAPCGACKSTAVHTRHRRSGRREFFVTACASCGASGSRSCNRDLSIIAWNRIWEPKVGDATRRVLETLAGEAGHSFDAVWVNQEDFCGSKLSVADIHAALRECGMEVEG